jgi:hypothetical protein
LKNVARPEKFDFLPLWFVLKLLFQENRTTWLRRHFPQEMATPRGLEPPTSWFVAKEAKILSALSGVAYGPKALFKPSQLSVDCP